MGRDVGQNEWRPLPGRHGEVANRRQPLAPKLDWSAEDQRVRAGDREEIPAVAARHPRRPSAISKPDDQLRAHRHNAALTNDETHELGPGPLPTQGHEIDHDDSAAIGGGELGFENQCAAPIAAPGPHARLRFPGGWRDPPTAIARVAQQRREARPRIEAGPTEPIDRAVLGDERGGLAIANQRVILDATRHEYSTCEICVARPAGAPFGRRSTRNSRRHGVEGQGRLRNGIAEGSRFSHGGHRRAHERAFLYFRAKVSLSVRRERLPSSQSAADALAKRGDWRRTERETGVKQAPPIALFAKAAARSRSRLTGEAFAIFTFEVTITSR